MAEYQLTETDAVVIRTSDSAHIPNDPANRDWQEYQDWLEAGGVPDPYVPPPEVPPPQDANVRLDTGVNNAADAYNANTSAQPPSDGLSTEERLFRLEETIKALCDGHMAPKPSGFM